MNRTKQIMMGLSLLTALLLVACNDKEEGATTPQAEIVLDEREKSVEEVLNESNKEVTETLQVAFFGALWEKETALQLTEGNWEKPLSKDIRFVLIDQKEELSKEKQKVLQNWLKEDKVVIFYGEKVQPEEVKEKLGMEIQAINVQSDASFDFPYLLYGYGFSNTYEQYVPIFLGSNTFDNFEEKIANFLIKNQNF